MAILGYCSAASVRQGRFIHFHLAHEESVSPTTQALRVECIGNASIAQTVNIAVEHREAPRIKPWEGYNWPSSYRFRIPRDWPSGLYQLVDSPDNAILFFVVLPRVTGRHSKILFQISTLTPAAYNWVDNRSFYKPENERAGVERPKKVSLNRPFPNPINGAALSYSNEKSLIHWLNENRIDVEYCTSIDLHYSKALLTRYDCMVIAYHDEYWTKAMRDHCEAFVRNGGNLIVLSGNTCFRQVRLLDDNKRSVVFYKYASLDPTSNADETAIAWAQPPVNRPQNSLLGVGFTHGAFGGARTAYSIRFPSHWVFAGVSAATTGEFMHYETDAAEFVDEPEGYPRVTGLEATPLNTTILASADLRHWTGKPGKATMTLYSRNGTVFNAATTDWVNALNHNPVLDQITLNVFRRLGRRINWNWHYIGHARNATAMTAMNGKLFLSTHNHQLWRRYPVGADVPWRQVGHAYYAKAMAATEGVLLCLTQDNKIWKRDPIDTDTAWQHIGEGPTTLKTLAAAGGVLYGVDYGGGLWRTSASTTITSWLRVNGFGDRSITSMASYSDILFATTEDNRLVRTNRDFIAESDAWHPIHHCNFAIGLAVIDWMLYVVTDQDALWQLDLTGLTQP